MMRGRRAPASRSASRSMAFGSIAGAPSPVAPAPASSATAARMVRTSHGACTATGRGRPDACAPQRLGDEPGRLGGMTDLAGPLRERAQRARAGRAARGDARGRRRCTAWGPRWSGRRRARWRRRRCTGPPRSSGRRGPAPRSRPRCARSTWRSRRPCTTRPARGAAPGRGCGPMRGRAHRTARRSARPGCRTRCRRPRVRGRPPSPRRCSSSRSRAQAMAYATASESRRATSCRTSGSSRRP